MEEQTYNLRNHSEKVKIVDHSKIKSYKSLFEDKLQDMDSELTKDEIIRIFSDLMDNKTHLENFKKLVSQIPYEVFNKISKRIKHQYKVTHKFITKVVEEEKHSKDSETKIIHEQKKLELEKEVNEKTITLKSLVKKNNEATSKIEEYYLDKFNSFMTKFNLIQNNSNTITPDLDKIILTKANENGETFNINPNEVIDFFCSSHFSKTNEILSEMNRLFSQTNQTQKALADEYLDLENEFVAQEKNYEILKNAKVNKEKLLIKNNLLF